MGEYKLYLEIFGYVGTALVIISMMMTSVVKLRIFNACGSLISMTYSIITNTWPIAVLNFALIGINLFHLLRPQFSKKNYSCLKLDNGDKCLDYFLNFHLGDIKKFFPNFKTPLTNKEVYAVFFGAEMVGVITGELTEDCFIIELDYTTPAYRDFSVAPFLHAYLKNCGVKTLKTCSSINSHVAYLKKMGFELQGDMLIKHL